MFGLPSTIGFWHWMWTIELFFFFLPFTHDPFLPWNPAVGLIWQSSFFFFFWLMNIIFAFLPRPRPQVDSLYVSLHKAPSKMTRLAWIKSRCAKKIKRRGDGLYLPNQSTDSYHSCLKGSRLLLPSFTIFVFHGVPIYSVSINSHKELIYN